MGSRALFGGICAAVFLAVLPAQTWQRTAASVHPLASLRVAMQFDPVRNRTICISHEQFEFSGRSSMHEWLGDRWIERDLPALLEPGPMAFDGQRQEVVLLRGWQVHAFDGLTWQALPSAAPIAWWGQPYSAAESVAFESLRGVLVAIHDGQAFELHQGSWQAAGGPTSGGNRIQYVAAEPGSGLVIGYALNGTTWRWNGAQWSPTAPGATPPPRSGAQFVSDPVGGRVLLVGGSDQGVPWAARDDVWAWNGTTWSQLQSLPGPRMYHGAGMHGGVLVVFGGTASAFGAPLPPTTLLGAGGPFVTVGEQSANALIVHDRARSRTVALLDGTRTLEFDGYRWIDTGAMLPGVARQLGFHGSSARCLALDAAGTTWLWDGTQWQLATTSGPAPRHGGGMAYDALRDRTVLFGGVTSQVLHETWLWDGASWSLASPAIGAPAAGWPSLAWDPAVGRVLLAIPAGLGSGALYSWDGQNWAPDGGFPHSGWSRIGVDDAGSRFLVTSDGGYETTWRWTGSAWSSAASPQTSEDHGRETPRAERTRRRLTSQRRSR